MSELGTLCSLILKHFTSVTQPTAPGKGGGHLKIEGKAPNRSGGTLAGVPELATCPLAGSAACPVRPLGQMNVLSVLLVGVAA